MRTPIFQIDAFTNRRLAGNPAAVMPMETFLADAVLQAIAAENNLSETAFLVPQEGDYRLRWFTPVTEVPLCGHATLASAPVVMEHALAESEQNDFVSGGRFAGGAVLHGSSESLAGRKGA
jgi:PhzF family phenazine biosynthesis protein